MEPSPHVTQGKIYSTDIKNHIKKKKLLVSADLIRSNQKKSNCKKKLKKKIKLKIKTHLIRSNLTV